jgi:hypothetical protein
MNTNKEENTTARGLENFQPITQMEMRTSSAVDISAKVTRQVAEIMRVATTSSNLKGMYVKTLRDAASYITTAWQNQSSKRTGPIQNSGTAATRLTDARLTALEEENAALQLSRRTACAHECPRCGGSTSESGRPPREGKSESARLAALEKRVEEIRPSIIRAIEERFEGRQLHYLETRQRLPEHTATGRSATAAEKPPTPPPRIQEEEEWKVVASKGARRKEAKKRMATDAGETARKEERAAVAPTPPAGRQQTQQPQ